MLFPDSIMRYWHWALFIWSMVFHVMPSILCLARYMSEGIVGWLDPILPLLKNEKLQVFLSM